MISDDLDLSIEVAGGRFGAYLARPWKAGPAPAIVVIQEMSGLDDDLRDTCDDLADLGFIAIAPDLFWRDRPGTELDSWHDSDWGRGLAPYQAYNFDRGVRDIEAVVRTARELPRSTGRVGVMGFCLGGLMTYLTAARVPIDAAAIYYGGGMERHLDEAWHIDAPMLIHFAEDDEFIPQAARSQIEAHMAPRPNVSVYTYPGCSHAFARQTGSQFDAAAASMANKRTYVHFDRMLRQ